MQLEYSPYIYPLIIASIVTGAVALYAWQRRSVPGARSLTFLSLAIVIWSLGYALEILGANLETKFFWGVIQYIGIALAPYFSMTFAYRFSDQGRPYSRWFVISSAVIPITTILLALTMRWHSLLWSEYHVNHEGDFSALNITHGPWFWVHLVYSYLMLMAGLFFLARLLWHKQGLYRGQGFILLAAVLAPWVGNALYVTGNSPIPHLDLTPFAFAITAVMLAWAVFGFRLVDISPIARERIIEAMQDGMVVLDVNGNIVDINPAAERMIGITSAMALGRHAREVFSPWPHLFERFRHVREANEQILVGSGNMRRRFQIRISPLEDRGSAAGQVILIRALGEEDATRSAIQTEVRVEADSFIDEDEVPTRGRHPLWVALVRFFIAPIKTDLAIPAGADEVWYRIRERNFTRMTRVGAFTGTISLIVSMKAPPLVLNTYLIFWFVVIFLWGLGLLRSLRYEVRAFAFLFLIYGLGVTEIISFGFSTDAMVLFMGLVVAGSAMLRRYGTVGLWVVSSLTMGVLGELIGSNRFTPLAVAMGNGVRVPISAETGIAATITFAGVSAASMVVIVFLIENMQSAWQKEKQTHYLLQQERDLLDRRVTERTSEVVAANKKYQTLVEHLPVVVYQDDASELGSSDYLSPQVETLLGYSLAEWEQDPLLWRKILHTEDRERAITTIEESLKAGASVSEYRLRARDGRFVWVRDEATLVRDENGQPQYIQGVWEDITARKRAEEELRISEDKYRTIFDTVLDVIYETNYHGVFTMISPSIERFLDRKPAELVGTHIREVFFDPTDYEKLDAAFMAQGFIEDYELGIRNKDGNKGIASFSARPILNEHGEPIGVRGIGRDITARKHTEEQLARRVENMATLSESSQRILTTLDVERIYAGAHDSAQKLMPQDAFLIAILDEANRQIEDVYLWDEDKLWPSQRYPVGRGLTDFVIKSGKPLRINEWGESHARMTNSSLFGDTERDTKSVLAVPMFNGRGQCFGMISAQSYAPGVYTLEHEQLLITLTSLVAKAIENAWLFVELQQELEMRKQADEKVRKLSRAVEQSGDSVVMMDRNGRIEYVNPKFVEVTGYSPADALGRSLPALMQQLAEEPDFSGEPWWQTVNLGNIWHGEFQNMRKDGAIIWESASIAPIFFDDQITDFIEIKQDVTARRQAEEQIRKLSRAVEQSGSSIVITDVNGNIEYVNPQFTRVTGYTLEEAIGQKPSLLKSGMQGDEFYKKLWQTITMGKTWRGVFHNKRKDGMLYWESATITPVQNQDGKITHHVAIKDDITRQKEIEDALQESYRTQSVLNSLLSLSLEDQTLEQMLNHALDIILTIPWLPTQTKGGIFLVEEDQPGVLNLKSQRNLDAQLLTLCAHVPFGRCLCGRAAASAHIEFADHVDERHENEYEGMQPHGHYNIPILSRGEVLGVLVLYLDVGRVRDRHETVFLEAVVSTLAAMIRDKRAEQALSLARDQALDASVFKSQLLARVSHELRTPLGGILGFAELMQIDAFGTLSEEQGDVMAQIVSSANYLEQMINDLLDQAQIEAKTLSILNDLFSPLLLLRNVEMSMSALARNKGISFTAEIDPKLPDQIVGDKKRLQQILFNLAGNAVKFTSKGGVHVKLFRSSARQWAMQVSDTGAGIPEEARSYIFEPFRQVDEHNISRENRGAGLGLSIVKQLVELLGGKISFESEVGKGSVFTAVLPLLETSEYYDDIIL